MLDAQRAQVQDQMGEEMLQDKLLLARRQLPDGQEEGKTSLLNNFSYLKTVISQQKYILVLESKDPVWAT